MSSDLPDNSVGYDGAFIQGFVVLMKHRLTHDGGCIELNKKLGSDRATCYKPCSEERISRIDCGNSGWRMMIIDLTPIIT
ncbi:hypothetical protein [Coleofasciculus sp. G2-EDA-02]|uniref:hypothetical protein n=1 Tax=Coleofasciculus sp. G2-EDA-02 TaxID=3069529 RepID=UPI0032F1C0BD